MEYKICENCGAKVHARTQKCPICNTVLTEASQIVSDVIENNTEINTTLGPKYDVEISEEKHPITENLPPQEQNSEQPQQEPKDYVYKAEVHHSLEYTQPLSNVLKVLLTTTVCMIPVFGQLVGTFFGIFFLTYDDKDRKSFGRVITLLSIAIFLLYGYTLMSFSQLINSGDFNNLLNNF